MRLFIAVLTAFLMLGASTLRADNSLRLPDAELQTGGNGKVVTTIVKFPLLSRQPGKIPVLKARIFYEKSKANGWNYAVSLFLNVHKMSVLTYGRKPRLLRMTPPANAKVKAWYRRGWLVMYGPGSGRTDARIPKTADGGWLYYFDISDLVKYTDTESEVRENHFQIACYLQSPKLPLKFRDMEIIYLTEPEADAKRKQ